MIHHQASSIKFLQTAKESENTQSRVHLASHALTHHQENLIIIIPIITRCMPNANDQSTYHPPSPPPLACRDESPRGTDLRPRWRISGATEIRCMLPPMLTEQNGVIRRRDDSRSFLRCRKASSRGTVWRHRIGAIGGRRKQKQIRDKGTSISQSSLIRIHFTLQLGIHDCQVQPRSASVLKVHAA